MSPRPVVHIFHHSYCEGGGIERYTRDFVDELIRSDRQVVVHARRIDKPSAFSPGLEFDPIRSAVFPRKFKDYFYHRRISSLAPTLKGTQFAMTRVPVRDGEVCGGTHRGYFKKARKVMGFFDRLQVSMEMKSYHHCRTVISHSRLCTGELHSMYQLPADRIATIHPPADLKRFHPVSDEERLNIRNRLGFPSDKVVFAFPSTGHKRKGLFPLVEAMKSFGDRALIALAGREAGGMPDHVRYLGHLGGDAMADLYRAADYTSMASYYEPFGLIGPESIMCGTPVLFEENMGCLEVIDRGVATTFNVWNQESIKCAIAEAIERVSAGSTRIREPKAALKYDASVETHVANVMNILEP